MEEEIFQIFEKWLDRWLVGTNTRDNGALSLEEEGFSVDRLNGCRWKKKAFSWEVWQQRSFDLKLFSYTFMWRISLLWHKKASLLVWSMDSVGELKPVSVSHALGIHMHFRLWSDQCQRGHTCGNAYVFKFSHIWVKLLIIRELSSWQAQLFRKILLHVRKRHLPSWHETLSSMDSFLRTRVFKQTRD